MAAVNRRLATGGFSAGTVLIVGMLCCMLGFTLMTLCTFQLSAAQTMQNNEQALQLAEGALAQTVSRFYDGTVNSTPYGLAGQTVTFVPYSRPDRYGQVTFDTTSPWGWSTNNYDGKHSTGWNNAIVPQSSVHIVARGVVGNTTRIVEALVGLQQYQYVLAVDGALNSAGPLSVKAEPDMSALAADPGLSSSMGANVGSNTLVSAASGSYVSGDIVCGGAITLNSPSTVLGAMRQGNITTPYIPLRQYDTSAIPATPTLSGSLTGPVTVSVSTYASGALTINGDLHLSNATLYVERGPLVINGALSGTGAVIVNGSVTVTGGADLDAANMVALLATGDVTLSGAGVTPKYFQGLVYTEGAFSASNITIAGAFVSATAPDSTSTTGSSLNLGPNTQVVYVPSATTIAPPAGPTATAAQMCNGVGGWGSSSSWSSNCVLPDTPVDTALYTAVEAAISGGSVPNGSMLNFTYQGTIAPYYGSTLWSGPGVSLGTLVLSDDGRGNVIFIQHHTVEYNALLGKFGPDTSVELTCSPDRATVDGWAQSHGTTTQGLIDGMEAAQNAFMVAANAMLAPSSSTTTTGSPSIPSLSLNNFIANADPVRILSWREH